MHNILGSLLLLTVSLCITASPVPQATCSGYEGCSPPDRGVRFNLNSSTQLADLICGTSGDLQDGPAVDNRNASTWNDYNMGLWFADSVTAYEALGWKYSPGGASIPDIQSLALHIAGNEGANKCYTIDAPGCDGTGYSFDLCRQYPEGHFVLWAIDNWANHLASIHSQIDDTTISLTPLTDDLVKQFYTPQTAPSDLLLPFSIFSALSVILSLLWAPLSAGAAIATVVNGAATQIGLDTPNPLVQWGEVQSALGEFYTQLTDALEAYYDNTLEYLPVEATDTGYVTNASQLPSLFMNGAYASQDVVNDVPILTQTLAYSAFATAGINALWAQDHVFILKISDASYGKGAGAACQAFPIMTVCVDGEAYIFARWVFTGIMPTETDEGNAYLDNNTWQVWGAYAEGSTGGTANADQLNAYNLDLPTILASAQRTLAINDTYPFTNQNGEVIDILTNPAIDPTMDDIIVWSLPLCDIDAVLGPHLHLNGPGDESGDDPIIRWGACTCVQQSTWPTTLYPNGDNDGATGYVAQDCQNYGWGSDWK